VRLLLRARTSTTRQRRSSRCRAGKGGVDILKGKGGIDGLKARDGNRDAKIRRGKGRNRFEFAKVDRKDPDAKSC